MYIEKRTIRVMDGVIYTIAAIFLLWIFLTV